MSAAETLESVIRGWVEDPASDVVYAELVEDRWAVRMRQTVRDATTVWWTPRQRSVAVEAYVLPEPAQDLLGVFRLCLRRNAAAWRVHFALDEEGAVVVRGRVPNSSVTAEELDYLLGEIYELVEISFRPLVQLAFGR